MVPKIIYLKTNILKPILKDIQITKRQSFGTSKLRLALGSYVVKVGSSSSIGAEYKCIVCSLTLDSPIIIL